MDGRTQAYRREVAAPDAYRTRGTYARAAIPRVQRKSHHARMRPLEKTLCSEIHRRAQTLLHRVIGPQRPRPNLECSKELPECARPLEYTEERLVPRALSAQGTPRAQPACLITVA